MSSETGQPVKESSAESWSWEGERERGREGGRERGREGERGRDVCWDREQGQRMGSG